VVPPISSPGLPLAFARWGICLGSKLSPCAPFLASAPFFSTPCKSILTFWAPPPDHSFFLPVPKCPPPRFSPSLFRPLGPLLFKRRDVFPVHFHLLPIPIPLNNYFNPVALPCIPDWKFFAGVSGFPFILANSAFPLIFGFFNLHTPYGTEIDLVPYLAPPPPWRFLFWPTVSLCIFCPPPEKTSPLPFMLGAHIHISSRPLFFFVFFFLPCFHAPAGLESIVWSGATDLPPESHVDLSPDERNA